MNGDEPDQRRPLAADKSTYHVAPVFAGDESASLEPSKYRLGQAARRLEDLSEVVDRLLARAAAKPLTIAFARQLVDAGEQAPPTIGWQELDREDIDLQHQARVLAGEVVYHLRTSLDYLAYHLVWLDRGSPYTHSQFPIVNDPKDWPGARKRIPKLTSGHLEMVRQLQPFAGCQWTGRLRRLSNTDKHRSMFKLALATGASFPLSQTVLRPDPADPTMYLADTTPQSTLRSDDGDNLPSALFELCSGVVTTVNEFSHSFGERADLQLSTD